MRTLFVVLLLGNLALAGWIFSQTPFAQDFLGAGDDQVSRKDMVADSKPPATSALASKQAPEAQDSRRPADAGDEVEEPPGSAGARAASMSDARICELLGPFVDEGQGEGILAKLRQTGVEAEISGMDVPGPSDYWVYHPPLSSRRAALRKLAEFQSKGIDSFVITQGALVNGVSLGLFTQKRSADDLVSQIQRLGYPAQIQEVYRSRREFWIEANYLPGGDGNARAALWQELEASHPLMQRKQNACK